LFLAAAAAIATRRVDPDVVVDVQNGVPFLSPLVTRRPVLVLVHHVHREQWAFAFGPRTARLGWWVESRVAPLIYRHSSYLALSEATAGELAPIVAAGGSGRWRHRERRGERVRVVGIGRPQLPNPRCSRSATPRIAVLGRLVPHKRVELALEAAAQLRDAFPSLALDVIGRGYWEGRLRSEAARLSLDGVVTFHGFVDEQAKADLLASAWVHVTPSVKEGWCIAVSEAALCGTASVALAGSGGLEESVVDGVTGAIVEGSGASDLAKVLETLLADPARLEAMGARARRRAAELSWAATAARVTAALEGAILEGEIAAGPPSADGTRATVALLRAFRREQEDPDRFYALQAAHCAAQLCRLAPLSRATVLDVGGGPGHLRAALEGAGARYLVLDADPAELHARGAPTGPSLLGDGLALPLAGGSVDICLSSNVLEHVADPEALAGEMLRVTRPGGICYLSYTNWLSPHGGHETGAAHLLLGGRRAAELYSRRHGHRPKNEFGVTLFPHSAARMLRWARLQERRGLAEVLLRQPRYHPSWARFVIDVPGLRELACWNVLLVLRRRPSP
ncbi:MAG TPA: glycosyltransferase, partial [Acidimicrobiales bacterium]|nr:glycosyltransferase [Acidimicrobiales bacterium]